MSERLDKRISHRLDVARKTARTLIRDGRVQVDGVVTRRPEHKVGEQRITVDGEPLFELPAAAAFHKDVGVQCTVGDPMGRRSLAEDAHELLALGLHPVGRLDADTSGLLLFSSDGALTQRLLHPRHAVEKTYRATVEGTVGPELGRVLAEGVRTAHGTHAARLDAWEANAVTLTVTEGKHRMVRRMLANSGHPVVTLTRLRMGAVTLGELPVSRWRELSEEELAWCDALLDSSDPTASGAVPP